MGSLYAPVLWTEALLTGTLATSVAVLAVAAIGLGMLSGQIEHRRAIRIILGCFILFTAPIASAALVSALGDQRQPAPSAAPGVPIDVPPPPPPAPYDPYAGASVPNRSVDGGDLLPDRH